MKRLVFTALLFPLVGVMAESQAPDRAQAPPTFRSDTDLVQLDVSIEADGKVVSDLTTADFQILDNGVRQRIESVERLAMPLDVTILVDVSSHTTGTWAVEVSSDKTAGALRQDVRAIASLLRPQDRLRVLSADTYVSQALPMRPAGQEVLGALSMDSMDGLPTVYDALVTALLRRPEPGRRHLIVAWVKALDFISVVDAASVRDVARHSDAVLHIVERSGIASLVSIPGIPRESYFRTWRQHVTQDPTILADVAALTGGTIHGAGLVTDSRLLACFKGILEEFLGGYVLRYVPQGVRREGWHDVTVSVPTRTVAVRTRTGYAIERPPGLPERARPVSATRSGPAPAALNDFAEAFRAQNLVAFNATGHGGSWRPLLREYASRAPLWPASPHLEHAFVLALVERPLLEGDEGERNDARSVLRRQHDLVRNALGPDEFECAWNRAEMALLQATPSPQDALQTIRQSETRCAGDARLTLGLAMASDVLWSQIRGTDSPRGLSDADVLKAYDAAMLLPQSAAEAAVRSAFFEYRRNHLEEAAKRLALAEGHASDSFVRYLQHLVAGRIQQKQGQLASAIREFRAALATWPGAQSARVGLMSALVLTGPRAEAEALAEAIQTAPAEQFDPFSVYWLGDYRAMETILRRMRELSQ